MTTIAIDIHDVHFTYDGESFVLNGLNASIKPGEFVCILGGNGSGKSTLAKHLNALLLPDKGTVSVCGNDTRDESLMYLIRSTAGMVFQNPDDQIVTSVVEDDVAFGPENLGISTPDIALRVKDALAQVGLMGYESHETNALSGGQKQRVAIAGVLAMHPEILVLDEASSMLDPRGRKGLMRVCRELNEAGMTIIMITHFMEEASCASRVIVMEKGHIMADDTPEQVLSQNSLLDGLNLEVPFAAKLSKDLQDAGIDIPTCVSEESLARALSPLLTHVDQNASSEKTLTAAGSAQSEANQNQAAPNPAQASPQADPLILFEHVSYTYDSAAAKKAQKKHKKRQPANAPVAERAAWGRDPEAVWALSDISLSINKGEFFGLAGHTGSGKSTLIQHMNGLMKPTYGKVLVKGMDLSDKKSLAAIRSSVGLVFQYPENQLFAETVEADVAFGPRNLGLSDDEVRQRVAQSLARVGLDVDEIGSRSPFELSGGQQRRVAFAGVLAMEPDVLILDEPVAGLDPAARRDFLQLIARLHQDGLTVVMVSHNMDDLAAYCSRIAVLNDGSLFLQGTPEEVFLKDEAIKSVGLGLPAPQRVAHLINQQGCALPVDRLYDEASLVEAIVRIRHA